MFVTAHIAAGLLIGKLTGNYVAALLGMLLLDLDHFYAFIKENVFTSWKRLKKVILFEEYVKGDRTPLHSFTLWLPISLVFVLIDKNFGVPFAIGYLAHLCMDMVDNSDFYAFWPWEYSFKGPIRYLGWRELTITLLLLFLWIWV